MVMSIETYLQNLRSKPEHIKRRMAFWTSFGVTAIIFMFWLGSFTAIGSSAGGSVAQAVNSVSSPGTTLVASVGSFFTDIKDIVFGPKKMVYSSVEVLPGK